MLTEEQIQRLAKKLADEHGDDEEECEKHVRFMVNSSKVAYAFLPENKKELFKKNLEGEFFEYIIQEGFSLGIQLGKIIRLIDNKINSLA